jgi:hypothetical protein
MSYACRPPIFKTKITLYRPFSVKPISLCHTLPLPSL